MLKLLLLLIAGFIVHIIRDYDRARATETSADYLKKNNLKIVGSFILSLCLFVVCELDGELSGFTSLTLGYSGSSFFKYLLEKNFPYAKF
jgi:hypothetical protein